MATAVVDREPVQERDLFQELKLEASIGDVEEAFYDANKALQQSKATRAYSSTLSRIDTGFKSWRDSIDKIDPEAIKDPKKRSQRANNELEYMKELAEALSIAANGVRSGQSINTIQNHLDNLDIRLKSLLVLFPEAPRPESVNAAAALPPQSREKLPYYYNIDENPLEEEGEEGESSAGPSSSPPPSAPKHRTSTMKSNHRRIDSNDQFNLYIRRAESHKNAHAHIGEKFMNGWDFSDPQQQQQRMWVDHAVADGDSSMHLGNVYGSPQQVYYTDPRVVPHHTSARKSSKHQ